MALVCAAQRQSLCVQDEVLAGRLAKRLHTHPIAQVLAGPARLLNDRKLFVELNCTKMVNITGHLVCTDSWPRDCKVVTVHRWGVLPHGHERCEVVWFDISKSWARTKGPNAQSISWGIEKGEAATWLPQVHGGAAVKCDPASAGRGSCMWREGVPGRFPPPTPHGAHASSKPEQHAPPACTATHRCKPETRRI